MASKQPVKKDYQQGERVIVTRKNHTYYGQTGTVSQVYSNGVYIRMDEDEKVVGVAFNTIRPTVFVNTHN
jgi:RNase P/RNase MRP subunit p29